MNESIAKKPGEQFEREVLELVRRMGFIATTTKSSGDGGIDIIAISNQPLRKGKYVIQCKDWTSPVGEPPIRDLYGVVHSERANNGILITTSRFTENALKFAEDKPIELIDGREYMNLLAEYGLDQLNYDEDDYDDEEQEKFNKGEVRLLFYDTNIHDTWVDNREAIGSFGNISFGFNSIEFNGHPISFSFQVTKYSEMSIDYEYNPKDSNMPYFHPENALITIKAINSDVNQWWILKIEAKSSVASQLWDILNNRHNNSVNTKACFVATVVYGDNECIEVEKLRNWRDSCLKKTHMGRRFINYYYKNGERWANAIKPYPLAKSIIRFWLDIFTHFLKRT